MSLWPGMGCTHQTEGQLMLRPECSRAGGRTGTRSSAGWGHHPRIRVGAYKAAEERRGQDKGMGAPTSLAPSSSEATLAHRVGPGKTVGLVVFL